ncbi:MAG: ATP-binding protein [Pseudobutyrivibrio ruminis]|nr:ATP-binding protein [Pseudobutyrivibrio ruminis]
MILKLSLKNQSIESSGITNDYKEAICEYVWNGFEAHATEVNIDYTLNIASGIGELSISDNGEGIVYNSISDTFGAFLTSQKNLLSLKMKSKANKGKGRFSFSAFATTAKWITIYNEPDADDYKTYEIVLNNDKKEVLNFTEPQVSAIKKTGTKVVFYNIFSLTSEDMAFEVLEPALLKEFAWFLYLYKSRKLKININGKPIDYKKYINTEYSEKTLTTINGNRFEVTLIVWEEAIKEKFRCYYFDSKDEVKNIETTSFNRNTVGFNHSVFVKSDYFDSHEYIDKEMENDQISLFIDENDKKVYKELKKFIAGFIEKKIGNYMSQKADDAVRQMIEERKTFPEFTDDPYGKMRKQDLEKVTKEIYKLEPKIFYKLKPVQEKSLLGFLNLLLNSQERENVLTIVEQIVELTPEQRQDFSDMLRKTKLENIVDTIKFIQERYKVIELLRTIVFDMPQYANERDHIQKIVQQHFWLFGEQFNLASSDERMKKALEKYTNILYGGKNIDSTLDEDTEQERRMDIFLCNTREVENTLGNTLEENIIVELKAPKVILSKKVLRQIEDYMDFVRKQISFNSELRRWKFIAVCKEVDEDVKGKYKTFEDRGKVGLVNIIDNYEVYALTWDDIFKSFELRHAPLLKRLNYDREKLAEELMNEVKHEEGRNKVNALRDIAVNGVGDLT